MLFATRDPRHERRFDQFACGEQYRGVVRAGRGHAVSSGRLGRVERVIRGLDQHGRPRAERLGRHALAREGGCCVWKLADAGDAKYDEVAQALADFEIDTESIDPRLA